MAPCVWFYMIFYFEAGFFINIFSASLKILTLAKAPFPHSLLQFLQHFFIHWNKRYVLVRIFLFFLLSGFNMLSFILSILIMFI